VFGFTGVIPGAMQVACFAYDWWEDQVYPLFMILPINIHDFWLKNDVNLISGSGPCK
jgi:hypothetical protein